MSSEKLLLESTNMSWYPPDLDEEDLERIFSLRDFIYFLVIVSALIRLCALSGSIYLIVIIARLKPPKTRINVIILLYAIFSGICLILGLAAYIPFRIVLEVTLGLEVCTEILMNFTLTFLALSWYVPNYHPELYNKFLITFKYGVGVFFLIVTLGIAVVFKVFYDISNLLEFRVCLIADVATITVCCLIVISFTILKRFKKPLSDARKTAYAFSISQVLLAMSAASTLIRIFITLAEDAHYYKMYLIFAGFSVYLYICEPIVLLVMLGRSSKDFRMAELKCCRKNMRNYGDDDLESNSGSEPAENNVTFHRSSENIRL
ncbi:uncharacterized protein LOC125504494 isoform X1 [Dendroctonus ponderosae]|nr:uncharacterized protein LOC125504494 isoform X1 [Dendroctonus ponderosae]XP_048522560.1 uncharacterized protein LOC125504494 isoform X1 [Dendroctonus ponderosae]